MSTQQSFHRQVTQEAAQWFATMQQAVTADERDRFARWLSQSARHVEEYLAVAEAWRMSADAVGAKLPADELIESARADLAARNVVPLRAEGIVPPMSKCAEWAALRAGWPNWKIIRLSAVASGAVAALGWLWTSFNVAEYRTGTGEQATALLADGSRVKLNTRTRIRARLSGAFRDVELLEGEALFKVAKDAHRPFRVFVKGSEIHAVGTEFDVYRRRDMATVTVVEGHVEVMRAAPPYPSLLAKMNEEVSAAAPVARLSPRQQAAVDFNGEVLRMRTVDLRPVTAWTESLLRFSGDTLNDVVEQFNRYNRQNIVLEDPELAGIRVSGVFSSTDIDSFIAYLKHTGRVVVEESGGVIHVMRETVPDSPQ